MSFPTGWGKKVPITIGASNIDALLSDFSVLVKIANTKLSAARSDRGDVRFSSDSAGSTQLAADYLDDDGTNSFWVVKIPSISATVDTVIYAWWGNASATLPPASDTYGADNAYDSDTAGYWPTGGGNDRTSNSNDATAQGGVTFGGTSGPYGLDATDYDGSDDWGEVASDTSLDLDGDFTFSCWVRPDTVSARQGLIARAIERVGGEVNQRVFLAIENTSKVWGYLRDSSQDTVSFFSSSSLTTGAWQHLVLVADRSSNATIYLNGSSEGSSSIASLLGTLNGSVALELGTGNGILTGSTVANFDGRLAGARVEMAARSAAWIAARYTNEDDPAAFASVGTVEDAVEISLSPTSVPISSAGNSVVVTLTGGVFADPPTFTASAGVINSTTRDSDTQVTLDFDAPSTPQDVTLTYTDADPDATANLTIGTSAYLNQWERRASVQVSWTELFDSPDVSGVDVLVQIDDADLDAFPPAKSDRRDVRFSLDEDSFTPLPADYLGQHASVSRWRVRLPSVDAEDNDFNLTLYAWWAHPIATLPAASDTYGAHNAYDSDTSLYLSGTTDRTSNAHSVTVHGGTTSYITSPVVQGLQLDGSDDRLTVTHAADLNPSGGALTIEFWRYVETSPMGDGESWTMVHKPGAYRVYLRRSGSSYYLGVDDGDGGTAVEWSEVINTNSWVHHALIFDGTSWTLQTNGTPDQEQTASAVLTSSTEDLQIGAQDDQDGTYSQHWRGAIDGLTISPVARSVNRVRVRYGAEDTAATVGTPTTLSTATRVAEWPGRSTVTQQHAAEWPGRSLVRNAAAANWPGRSRVIFEPAAAEWPGRSRVRTSAAAVWPGRSILRAAAAAEWPGRSTVALAIVSCAAEWPGRSAVRVSAAGQWWGASRVANDLDQYELFVGVDAEPDLDAAPAATSDTLPFDYTLTGYPAVYHLVVRARDPHGLRSLNVYSRQIELDASGNVVSATPTAPSSPTLTLLAGLRAVLRASYARGADDSPADRWSLRVRTDGTDPVVADTPTLLTLDAGEPAQLGHVLGAYADGTDLRVLLRTHRTSDGAESPNTDALSLTINDSGGQISLADAFAGDRYVGR